MDILKEPNNITDVPKELYNITDAPKKTNTITDILKELYNITNVPKKPDDITDKARKNWNNFWEIASALAKLIKTQPTVQDDNSFCIEGEKIAIILYPDLESYHVHLLDNSNSFGNEFVTLGGIIDTLREKHLI
jgi:hypothetical protein